MGGSLSSCDPHLERLRQDLEHMALALGQLSQAQEAVVRQGYLPRYGPVTAAEQAHVRDGVVRSQERARGDDSGATTGQPGDARDAGGLEGVGLYRRIGYCWNCTDGHRSGTRQYQDSWGLV